MAASFYSNSQHVDFESVLTMEDPVKPVQLNRTNHQTNPSLSVVSPMRDVTSHRSSSLLRPPWPEPRRMDHPQVQPVLTRPTRTRTTVAPGRTSRKRRCMGGASTSDVRSILGSALVRPSTVPHAPLLGLPSTTLDHQDSSHSPTSNPLAEEIHETIRNMVQLHESCMDL
ncbi:hypothetical protein F511_40562 [Dorcoceras hygrometricum]|uniref:Uncharacterized protein n=1 Tax=Dorcoceras hygrometricum TaxID=472368 RepID=A0A2Z7DCZ3_9LAMI|nr:hypothetical protein F511_40562 [Dorcoceras hygrometricum]